MLLPLDLLSLAVLTLSSLAELPLASAVLANLTIDDTLGDHFFGTQIEYNPPGVWKVGQDCTDCTARIDPSQTLSGTWHDGTFSPVAENGGGANELLTATVSFEGVAVYVFCIVAHTLRSPVGRSDMAFFLNGTLVGNFTQEPTGDTNIDYDVPVYSNPSLPFGNHTITIVNGHVDGPQSLTLLDYIYYTRDISPSSQSESSLTPTETTSAANASSSSTDSTAMVASGSSGSSRTRTIVIATVASIGGLLVIAGLTGLYFCLRRRRYRAYESPTTGVIDQDAARIEEEDTGTSGWVEGTWARDDDSTAASSSRRSSSKRKRGPSTSRSPIPPVPSPISTFLSPAKAQGPTLPPSTVSGVPTFRIAPSQMSHARADPMPLSPTSSFGNLTSTVPDSATYLLTPPVSSTGFPKYPNPTSNPNLNSSDTFLDMSRSFVEPDAGLTTLASHAAHPFATAQAVAPSSYNRPGQRSGRERSDSNQSNRSNRSVALAVPAPALSSVPPPNASSSALSLATAQGQGQGQRSYTRGPTKKTSGSDLGTGSASSNVSPSSVPQTLPSGSAATTPTSTTALMPQVKRQGSNASVAGAAYPGGRTRAGSAGASHSKSHSHSQSQSQPQSQPQPPSSQSRAPPRRVDPVDPAMQPPRDGAAQTRERDRRREREREKEQARRERQPQTSTPASAPAPTPARAEATATATGRAQRGGRRQGVVVSERDRQRFGNFLDVPVDAASESRPPSYREGG